MSSRATGRAASRSTFREALIVGDVCHQRRVRDEMALRQDAEKLFPTPPPVDLSLKRARVREITREQAWKVISRYEWLGTLPSFCSRFFGLFFGDFLGSVACYGVGNVGAGNTVAKRYGLDQRQLAYLARGAAVHWAPLGSAPKLINYSTTLLGREGCVLAIAYSDTEAGEIGTVYQASGWVCLGPGTTMLEWVSPQGRVYNTQLPRDVIRKNKGKRMTWREAEDALRAAGWRQQKSNPKIRYVRPLVDLAPYPTCRAVIASERVPYPKRPPRADQVDGLG